MDGAGLVIVFDLHAEHPIELSDVCDLGVLAQGGLGLLDETRVGGSNGAVVYTSRDDRDLVLLLVCLVEPSLVDRTALKAEREENVGQFLLELVQSPHEAWLVYPTVVARYCNCRSDIAGIRPMSSIPPMTQLISAVTVGHFAQP